MLMYDREDPPSALVPPSGSLMPPAGYLVSSVADMGCAWRFYRVDDPTRRPSKARYLTHDSAVLGARCDRIRRRTDG